MAFLASFKRALSGVRRSAGLTAFLFLLPFLVLFVVFRVGPVLASLALSFTGYDGIGKATWVGLANYRDILVGTEANTRLFWRSVTNTLYYTVGQVGLEMIAGLALALLVNSRLLRVKAVWRVAYYIPVVTSAVASSMIWLWLYHPQAGFLNAALEAIGLSRVAWLSNPSTAMLAIIIMAVWSGAGWSMVVYLAGLQGIPQSIYEAARIDGATERQQFIYITLPLLAPVTLFIVIIGCISALQVFSQVYVRTSGGPLNATITVTYNIWQQGFRYLRLGYSSAMSFLLFLIILLMSILNNRLFGGSVEY